ncbi:benzoate/H(+) symporter BenE family transporter [Marivibrio halodurans]|uniref:Benzoate/H(+) symporter BenE family transporter n=1 Tax=Marivibrio halodurans TaxID=2039722 RepID=A0A8J7UZS4_9PROT|nr:benzoate/H(+) symporter BenE family transporter [Marivibrio halodurans]MBP5855991.1 benzoate/H(+) symporter BenE family transporter [Marivibrio halodurans]
MRPSLVSSALVAALVGFGGSGAVVLSAIQAVGATPVESASWLTALCLSMAGTSFWLSWRHRMPILAAWSTPGAALLGATAVGGATGPYDIQTAVGAFLAAGALILASGLLRPLSDAIARIPGAVAAAMLAGVLIAFPIAMFDAATADPLLILPLIGLYLVARLISTAWAVILVIGAAVAWAMALDRVAAIDGTLAVADLTLITPTFTVESLIGLALPLFLVSMASQNLPGFAVLRAAGYEPPARSALTVTGIASIVTAPFGAHTTTMAAITAALCTGPDTHPDPAQRWKSGLFYAFFYLVLAAVGVSLVSAFSALPASIVTTVAGLALLTPLMGALKAAMAPEETRFAATATLAATASGLTLLGVGSAFWGLALGLLVLGLEALARRLKG